MIELPPLEQAGPDASLWRAVDELVDRAPLLSDLRRHGLHLLAAHRWVAEGRPMPDALRDEYRASAYRPLIVGHLLEQLRDATAEPVVIMKGIELAARYPEPSVRPFRDIDVLAHDAAGMQRDLLAAGFEELGIPSRYEGIHHLRPLVWTGLPVVVEVHERPKWVGGIAPPSTAELLARAVPSSCGVDGILTLAPEDHVLAVAAHSWAHVPLNRALHLLDVAVMLAEVDPDAVAGIARDWKLDRVWATTLGAVGHVLVPMPIRAQLPVWARNVAEMRERTVLEAHLERGFSAFSAFPPGQACRYSATALRLAASRDGDESRSTKFRRARRALRDAFARQSEHHEALDSQGIAFGPTLGER
jgi:hypothetical protein